jgi:protein AroM
MSALRVLTIGQSPRPDLEAEIAAAVPGLRVLLQGALDELSRAELTACAPRGDGDTLFTMLPSGEGIAVSKAIVTERLRAKLATIGGPVMLACTGAFAGLPERVDLVQPSAVLNAIAAALLPRGRLGIAVPFAEQIATLAGKRARDGVEVTAVAYRPGSGDAARADAAAMLAAAKPDLVILDCISYTRADRAAFVAAMPCPVLLSITVAARAAACLLPE